MTTAKLKLEDYTEAEFLSFLENLFEPSVPLEGDAYEEYIDTQVKRFVEITEHPSKTDLIFYPREGVEDSPKGILKEVKEWREKNGKPGFKIG
ncbi:bacteriocin immunity protein [Pseudomonas caspiana]